jgi:hypothetical protein
MAVSNEGAAPSWLFSFVDLAFLMLIAMTQLAGDVNPEAPDLGEMVVPRIGADNSNESSTGSSEAWQLRVHPRGMYEGDVAFELVLVGAETEPPSEWYAEVEQLRERLVALQQDSGTRPVLAPHEDSRSQDMLDAAALIEEFWPGRRRVTVARVFDS